MTLSLDKLFELINDDQHPNPPLTALNVALEDPTPDSGATWNTHLTVRALEGGPYSGQSIAKYRRLDLGFLWASYLTQAEVSTPQGLLDQLNTASGAWVELADLASFTIPTLAPGGNAPVVLTALPGSIGFIGQVTITLQSAAVVPVVDAQDATLEAEVADPVVFLLDEFNGAASDTLATHTADNGATWLESDAGYQVPPSVWLLDGAGSVNLDASLPETLNYGPILSSGKSSASGTSDIYVKLNFTVAALATSGTHVLLRLKEDGETVDSIIEFEMNSLAFGNTGLRGSISISDVNLGKYWSTPGVGVDKFPLPSLSVGAHELEFFVSENRTKVRVVYDSVTLVDFTGEGFFLGAKAMAVEMFLSRETGNNVKVDRIEARNEIPVAPTFVWSEPFTTAPVPANGSGLIGRVHDGVEWGSEGDLDYLFNTAKGVFEGPPGFGGYAQASVNLPVAFAPERVRVTTSFLRDDSASTDSPNVILENNDSIQASVGTSETGFFFSPATFFEVSLAELGGLEHADYLLVMDLHTASNRMDFHVLNKATQAVVYSLLDNDTGSLWSSAAPAHLRLGVGASDHRDYVTQLDVEITGPAPL